MKYKYHVQRQTAETGDESVSVDCASGVWKEMGEGGEYWSENEKNNFPILQIFLYSFL